MMVEEGDIENAWQSAAWELAPSPFTYAISACGFLWSLQCSSRLVTAFRDDKGTVVFDDQAVF